MIHQPLIRLQELPVHTAIASIGSRVQKRNHHLSQQLLAWISPDQDRYDLVAAVALVTDDNRNRITFRMSGPIV
jgi:hypothetical protein